MSLDRTGAVGVYPETNRRNPWGNLNQKVVTKCMAENLSVAVNASNQLQGYSHDAAGNMTVDNSGTRYVYDAENRISSTSGFSYVYDADGNRVQKANGNTTPVAGSLYWSMSSGIVAESDLLGNLRSEYVFFDGQRVARKDFPGNAVSYYFSAHLKTASVITDATGTIKSESDYYPWGGELQYLNNDPNRYKFTGKERDNETGLDFYGARYYGSALGRFLSPDWSAKPSPVPYAYLGDPQSLNLYAYVVNNPITKNDPTGHNWFQQDGKWQWHKGDKYTYSDKDGNKHTLTSKYTSLLVAQPTGTNRQGATTYKLTLFNQDQKVAEGTAFSGGGGNPAIKAGNYTINTNIRDPNGPNTINPNSAQNNPPPFFGIQKMHNIPAGNGMQWPVVGAYGEIRARLNPWSGTDDGDYFHGQSNGHGYTHGCLCYGTDTRFIDYLWNAPPQKVPVAVDVPVVQP